MCRLTPFVLPILLGACSDASLKTVNAIPTASINSHADGDEILEEPVTVLFGRVADSNHSASELTANWYVDGDAVCEDGTPEDDGSTACEVALGTGDVTVVLEVSDPKNASASDSVTFTVNPTLPPEVSLVAPFDGDRYRAGESIEFRGYAMDEEDGIDISVWIESDIQGVLDIAPTLDADGEFSTYSTLIEGDHVITLRAEDSSGKFGEDNHLVEVLPANRAPVVESVVISPSEGVTLETGLSCLAVATDPDEETPAIDYAWSIDGVEAGVGPTLEVSETGASVGQTVTCTATATDGEGATDSDTDSVVIENRPPRADSVTIGPDAVYTNDTIAASVAASDPDGDSVEIEYAWYVNAGLVAEAGSTLSGADYFDKHDEVHVVVTPHDGSEAGESVMSDTITVLNSLPTAPEVSIVADEADNLVCTIDAESTDADSDPLGYTFSWDVDGTLYTDATTTTLAGDTVPAGATGSGGTWTCTVTPDDGEADGPPGSDSLYVEGAPVGDCVSLNLDGETDDVVVPASADFVAAERGLTIEAWVKWDGHTDSAWYPVATQGWGDSTTARFFLAVSGTEGSTCSGVSEPGYLHFEVHTSFSTGICLASDTALDAGEWHHVAAVFDAGVARIYVDGVYEKSGYRDDETLHVATASELKIGLADVGGGLRFAGALSSVRYSSSALYDETFSPVWPLESDSETIGLWPLDDGGSTALDGSGAGHDGAISGGTWVEQCPDADADGYTVLDDCEDTDEWIHPFAGDTYDDGTDSDCDGLDCEAGFSGSTYFVACFAEESWEDSNDLCVGAGYDGLATILNSTENSDATAMMAFDESPSTNDLYWIGFSDSASEGSYEWLSGLPVSYTNWAPSEPSDGGAGEDCGHIYSDAFDLSGQWNDHFCTMLQSYVCEAR